ncbi:hypothetical protein DGWBC_0051 [Dehalogenimonas sp. WBC-2]|nr:hypothetical protein DGWBC_0051 [Dehalogenimonas sp. WBC-2]
MEEKLKKLITLLVVSFCLVASLAGCNTGAQDYPLNQQFTLSPGQSAKITSEDIAITFNKVLNDSRCPVGATCIWEGQVQCLISIKLDGKTEQLTLTQSGSDTAASQIYDKYRLEFNVKPYPKLNDTINSSEYVLELKVSSLS